MRPGAAIPFHKLHFAHALVGPVSPGCINQKIPIAAILSFLFFFEDRTAPRQRRIFIYLRKEKNLSGRKGQIMMGDTMVASAQLI